MASLRPRLTFLLRRLLPKRQPPASRSYSSGDARSRPYYNNGRNGRDRIEKAYYEDYEPSSWKKYWFFITPAALALGLASYIRYNDERRTAAKDVPQTTAAARTTNNRPMIGGPFKLIDTEGRIFTQENLRGDWSLIYFGYTSCPDIGPNEAQKMAEAVEILKSKYNLKITPVFITIDPLRDTPAQLKAYLGEFNSGIVGLTGPITAVRQTAQEYRVFFKKVDEIGEDYLVESSHKTYLIDPNLEAARAFGTEYNSSELAEAVESEVKKANPG